MLLDSQWNGKFYFFGPNHGHSVDLGTIGVTLLALVVCAFTPSLWLHWLLIFSEILELCTKSPLSGYMGSNHN